MGERHAASADRERHEQDLHHDGSAHQDVSGAGEACHEMSDMSHHDMCGHDMSGMAMSPHDMDGHGKNGHDMSPHNPMPGMAMSHGGHAGHGDHVARFRRLFWIMLALAVPVAACSPMFAAMLGYRLPDVPGLVWVSPALGVVMYVWGGRPFLSGAVGELRDRRPGMMLLIATAITVALLASLGASLGLLPESLEFWWELALLIVIMLLGHWLEMRSLARTGSALDSLAALLPDEAEIVDGDATRTVPVADLAVGDVFRVRPGGRVPADGVIHSGQAGLDESAITGESAAVVRGPGDHVVAGTVSTDSAITVTVTAIGADTALAGIRRLVASAQSSSTRAQRLADRAAGWLFWYALAAAAVTAVVWSVIGSPQDALTRTITVLVIACPHALGLAIPLVVSIGTERAARAGVLVSNRMALERMRRVDTVLFDKTGTLTEGRPAVVAVAGAHQADVGERPAAVGAVGRAAAESASAETEAGHAADAQTGAGERPAADAVLALAAATEGESEHPLGRAIVAAARERGLVIDTVTAFASSPAVGVTATVAGRSVRVGGPRLLAEAHAEPMPEADGWAGRGWTVLHVLVDGRVVGAIALADAVRPESAQAVAALRRRGVTSAMITGDAEQVAREVAARVGIERVFAGVRPEDKARRVARLQHDGHVVAMVGDGVNDAPALAGADVGLAIGAGTDVARASADVVLAGSDPRAVLSVLRLSQASWRKMVQNLWWAAGYNLVAVPLAAGALAPVGFTMPMSVGAILMSLSAIIVAVNAQTLRRLDLDPADCTRE